MPREILLPALAADIEGGVIEEWHKQVGDAIDAGDVIAEVSTDKAVIELEAEHSGTLGKILVPAGPDEVAVHTPIAILLLDGETPDALEESLPGATVAALAAPVGPQPETESDWDVPSTSVDGDAEDTARVFASPVAIRIADQLGIDLHAIDGSGPGGRIVLGDVEEYAGHQGPVARPAAATVQSQTPTELPPQGTYTKAAADKIRDVIARRLGEAKRDIPHFYLSIDCELDALLEARRTLNESTEGVAKVSVNDFIIKVCALALRDVPAVNTGWADDSLLNFNDVNVAVAVATPKGLMTPVLNKADTKDVMTISSEFKALATRAREGRLKPEEYKGGSFTLSNLGMYGIREFSAIINPPQSCILAVGAGRHQPTVKNGEIVVATVMSCTLSVDHRAVDGALGAKFLRVVKQYIEQPKLVLA